MKQYRNKLPISYRKNGYTYNWAKYNFHIKNYDEVMRLLQDVTYQDVFYNLDSKSMLVKTYYELGEENALTSLLESFKIYLHRNKLVSHHHRTNYLNFITILNSLAFSTKSKKDVKLLKRKLKETRQIADMNWLMEKINERVRVMS